MIMQVLPVRASCCNRSNRRRARLHTQAGLRHSSTCLQCLFIMGAGRVSHVSSMTEWNSLHAKSGNKAVVVDFTAAWCGPCKMMAPVFEGLSLKHTNLLFVKVDVDDAAEVASTCKVRAMPTFQIFQQGNKVEEIVGADAKTLEALCTKYNAASSPFSGHGRKLGSTDAPSSQAPTASSGPAEGSGSQALDVDSTKPTTSLQIRLSDGTRLTGTFNHEHTVGDIRRFIASNRPGATGNLMTAFPPKQLSSDSETLVQASLLNSVIMER